MVKPRPGDASMKKVLFVGDINVDVLMGGLESLPVLDKEITCRSFDIAVGSSAVISAAAYASLGGGDGTRKEGEAGSSFLGLAGRDDYGEFMIRRMKELGIRTDLVRRTDKVRTGVTVNLIYQNTRTQVTYPGTISEFEGTDVGERELAGIDHMHFAGPYLQTKFRPEIERLLKLAKSLGITTSLDPQWDPREKWEHMQEWLGLLSYLFVNEGEAISITGAATLEGACRWLSDKTACSVVKAGREGSMILPGGPVGKIYREPAKSVKVVDTTGAGDCFDAGFLYGVFEKGLSPREALKIANATGSRSCMFPGGVAHRSTYADIVKFMENE
jgi:sugar/nucleoside kinase (ribokinase family)